MDFSIAELTDRTNCQRFYDPNRPNRIVSESYINEDGEVACAEGTHFLFLPDGERITSCCETNEPTQPDYQNELKNLHISHLPVEIQSHLTKYLSNRDWANLSASSRLMRDNIGYPLRVTEQILRAIRVMLIREFGFDSEFEIVNLPDGGIELVVNGFDNRDGRNARLPVANIIRISFTLMEIYNGTIDVTSNAIFRLRNGNEYNGQRNWRLLGNETIGQQVQQFRDTIFPELMRGITELLSSHRAY
jgi:hypothetical protein